jgi:16S rRNA (uracil1498-N3)-methyltransferase
MPVYFINSTQVADGTVTITGPLCDHLRGSLRVSPGEELWLADDRRRRYRMQVESADRGAVTGRILEERQGPPPSACRLVLGQALLKGERMDWLIQKATELGVAGILPLVTARTIVRPVTGRTDKQQQRWQAIALEAAQQSERWDLPEISPPIAHSDFLSREVLSAVKLILAERGEGTSLGSLALTSAGQGPSSIVLAVGPEGGWSDEEVAQALAAGFLPVTLGKRILRAETAALASLSVIQSRLGELG